MIKSIEFLTGEVIELNNLTVFTGPQNSGKSTALREIYSLCQNGSTTNSKVIDDVSFISLDSNKVVKVELETGNNKDQAFITVREQNSRVKKKVRINTFKKSLLNPNENKKYFAEYYLRGVTSSLNARQRYSRLERQELGDLKFPPKTSFQFLFKNEDKRKELQQIVYDTFGMYLVFDPTDGGKLSIRLSSEKPSDTVEKDLGERGIDYFKKATPIEQFSDGIQAFIGIVLELFSEKPEILFIDEPEGSLSGTFAYDLGRIVSEHSKKNPNRRIITSTHNPDFLLGCMHANPEIKIIRLSFSNKTNIASTKLLEEEVLKDLMTDPLLKSSKVIDAIFAENVVVVEGNSDRAFYQEINDRLVRFKPERGITRCKFVDAHNKQTVHKIVEPLKKLGVKVVSIIDLDILKEWKELKKVLDAHQVEATVNDDLLNLSKKIKGTVDDLAKNKEKEFSLKELNENAQNTAESHLSDADMLVKKLENQGVWLVPGGSVESWLCRLVEHRKNKSTWLVGIFEKMGSNSEDKQYIKPTDEDVWKFISDIKKWFDDHT